MNRCTEHRLIENRQIMWLFYSNMPITIFFDIAQLISLALIPRQNFINIQGQNPVFACGDLIQLGWQMKCWIFTEIDKMCKMVRSNSIWGLKFVTIFFAEKLKTTSIKWSATFWNAMLEVYKKANNETAELLTFKLQKLWATFFSNQWQTTIFLRVCRRA